MNIQRPENEPSDQVRVAEIIGLGLSLAAGLICLRAYGNTEPFSYGRELVSTGLGVSILASAGITYELMQGEPGNGGAADDREPVSPDGSFGASGRE